MLQTFLAIIGGIVLAIVFLLVLGLIVARWKLRKLVRQFEDLAGNSAFGAGQIIPPLRVRLRPDNSHEWIDAERIKTIGDELSDSEFVRIGTFSTEPETLPLEAWHDSERSIYATINEHPVGESWLDFVSLGKDGSTFTISSGPDDRFTRPENFHLEHMTDADTSTLLAAFLERRPDTLATRTSAETFPAAFEDAWRRLMDFRIEQGVPSDDVIRHVCFADADNASEDEIEQVREMWRMEISGVQQQRARESFLTDTELTALEWDRIRDRVVFVLDESPASELALILINGQEDDFDDGHGDPYDILEERIEELLQGSTPRAAFAEFNAQQSSDDRFEKIGEVSEPVGADVYLGSHDIVD